MTRKKTLVIDIPTLRLDWIEQHMPRLHAIAKNWHRGPITPVFPGLTCSSQASLTTGRTPEQHGIIANGLYDRETRLPEFWTFTDEKIADERLWETCTKSGGKSGVFFFLNIRNAKADVAILPKPIHNDDGSMQMWCWHKPEGLYPELVKSMGHFNLLFFWGPMAGIASSKWIAQAAQRSILENDLDLSFIYLPHTDYAPQKFGPDSDAYRKAHTELDGVLSDLLEKLLERWPDLGVMLISEYGISAVDRAIYPNRLLREAKMLAVETRDGREYLDYVRTPAIALADHQICHIYCNEADPILVAELFRGMNCIEQVITNPSSAQFGHRNSGDVILIADPNAWFAYPWWTDFAVAPDFANKMDIHNKPGYDPLEMYWDPKINGTSQDDSLVRGSHGAPARREDQMASMLSNLDGADGIRSTLDAYACLRKGL